MDKKELIELYEEWSGHGYKPEAKTIHEELILFAEKALNTCPQDSQYANSELAEALEKAVSLIKTQYFANFPDTDESEFESFRKIDPHMIVIDKALKQQNDD